MKTSLIISTYNWTEALNCVLECTQKQSVLPSEIIIADDGSREETSALIKKWQKKSIVHIVHVWHEDTGFKLAQIRNKAVAKAKGDYIIQIDGDIIMHRDFVKDHINLAEKGCFIHGSRVWLSEATAKQLLTNKRKAISLFDFSNKNYLNQFRLPLLGNFLTKKSTSLSGTRGCNFSFWKDDFIAVNGFNEDIAGWGKEDTELSARLIHAGNLKKKAKFYCVAFHLYHPIASKNQLNQNNSILDQTIANKSTWCNNGINKYLQ